MVGWAAGRYSNGTVYPDAKGFPDGIKSVADYVHSKGLLFGIYTDRGTSTCAERPGSYNYEKIDAQTYASWLSQIANLSLQFTKNKNKTGVLTI